MYRHHTRLSRKDAQLLAVAALSFLADDPERLGRFLSLTGINPRDLRITAQQPAFLVAVLEHVAGDAGLLDAFAAASQRTPAEVEAARVALAGPAWERDTA